MFAFYGAATERNRRTDHLVDVQEVKCQARTADINDGINSADFMEVNFVGRGAMHCGFGFCEFTESSDAQFLNCCWQFGGSDHLFDFVQVAPVVVVVVMPVAVPMIVIVRVSMVMGVPVIVGVVMIMMVVIVNMTVVVVVV